MVKDPVPRLLGRSTDVHPSVHGDLTLQGKFTPLSFLFTLSSSSGLTPPPSLQGVEKTTTPSPDLRQARPHRPELSLCKRVITAGRPQPELSDRDEAIVM